MKGKKHFQQKNYIYIYIFHGSINKIKINKKKYHNLKLI